MSPVIQMEVSLKPKSSSNSLVPFLESTTNLKQFEKKMIVIATLFRKLQTVNDLVRQLFKKHLFRNSFDNQHFKESQTLAKYPSEHFHHIF